MKSSKNNLDATFHTSTHKQNSQDPNQAIIRDLPLVSIILANYNNARYVGECIHSLLRQTYPKFELIIVDDASTDDSVDIITQWAKKDSRIRTIQNPHNLGIAGARNEGLHQANGDYIAIMDGDDVCTSRRLEKTVSFLETHPEVFLVGSSVYVINEHDQVVTHFPVVTEFSAIRKQLDHLLNPMFVNTILFRNTNGIRFREQFAYCEDYDFYLNLITAGKQLRNVPEPLVYYRKNRASVSFSKKTKMALFFQKAFEFYRQRCAYGHDTYNQFHKSDILQLDIKKLTPHNRQVLEYEIVGHFQIENYAKVRELAQWLFHQYGYLNKNLFYYWASRWPWMAEIYRHGMRLFEKLGLRQKMVRKIIT